MTIRKLLLLYEEYKKEFGYRDRTFVALHQFLGIQEVKSDDDIVPGEDVI